MLRAVVEGLELGAYRFENYKSSAREEKNPPRLTSVQLALIAHDAAHGAIARRRWRRQLVGHLGMSLVNGYSFAYFTATQKVGALRLRLMRPTASCCAGATPYREVIEHPVT